jgi:hypothetical protein
MLDKTLIKLRINRPLSSTDSGGPSFTGVEVHDFDAGPVDNPYATPPTFKGANNLVKGEYLSPGQTVVWDHIWEHDIGRLGGEHRDTAYVRNLKPGQTFILRNTLSERNCGGLLLVEAGCGGNVHAYDCECVNVAYPTPVVLKPTHRDKRIIFWMNGCVRCHVQIDRSQMVAGQVLRDCLEVHLGTNPSSNMPDWSGMGIVPIPISIVAPPPPPVDPCEGVKSSLALCQTVLKNTEAEVMKQNRRIAELESQVAVLVTAKQSLTDENKLFRERLSAWKAWWNATLNSVPKE